MSDTDRTVIVLSLVFFLVLISTIMPQNIYFPINHDQANKEKTHLVSKNTNTATALKFYTRENLSLSLDGHLGNLNPVSTSNGYSWEILSLIFDGLIVPNPFNYTDPRYDTNLLLEEPPKFTVISNTSAKWTLKLRRNITFFDGEPLTAWDLNFTLNLIWWLGEDNYPWYYVYYIYNGSKVIDNYTIDVYVNTVGIMAAYSVLDLVVFPKHIYEKEETWGVHDNNSEDTFPNWDLTHEIILEYTPKSPSDPILTGYGPFMLSAWYPTNVVPHKAVKFVLHRNPNYYLRAVDGNGKIIVPWRPITTSDIDLHGPYIETLIFRVYDNYSSLLDALINRKVDAVEGGMDMYGAISMFNNSKFGVIATPRMGFGGLLINTRINKPAAGNVSLFRKPKFRSALAAAINKTGICVKVFDGWADPLDTMLPRMYGLWSPEYTGELPRNYYNQNKTRALEYLAELGIRDYDNDGWLEWNSSDPNSEINITLMAMNDSLIREIIDLVARDIESIGIHVNEDFVDFYDWLNAVFITGNFQVAFLGFGLSRLPYIMEFFSVCSAWSYKTQESKCFFYCPWYNDTYDELVFKAIYLTSNWSDTFVLIREADKIVWYEEPLIPIYQNKIVGIYDKNITGIISIPEAPVISKYTIMKATRIRPGISLVSPRNKSYFFSSKINIELEVSYPGISNVSLFANDSLVAIWYPNNISDDINYILSINSGFYIITAVAYYANGAMIQCEVAIHVLSHPLWLKIISMLVIAILIVAAFIILYRKSEG